MHKSLFYFLLIFLSATAVIGQKEVTSDSEITSATVYLNGAEVYREATVSVSSGVNIITLDDLSPYIIPNSIQVKANDQGVMIASVNRQTNYLKTNKNSRELALVNDSIEDLNFSKSLRTKYRSVYAQEKDLLLVNKSIKGEQNGVDIEDLMDMADFYRERLIELETKILDIDLQLADLNKNLNRLNKQKTELSKGRAKNTSEIVINLSSNSTKKIKLTVQYVVTNAGWVPNYDIRSKDISMPIDLVYKAEVYNSTGYDWNNVKLTLSTGNPTVDNTQPELNRWYLTFYEQYQAQGKKRQKSYGYANKKASAPAYGGSIEQSADEVMVDDLEEESSTFADFTNVTESNVTAEFKINLPYSIKSNGKPNIVEIQKYELPVEYSYLAIPKLDPNAFLIAGIAGWGNYNLLPGEANIYYEGTFVGQSYLDTETTDDTLDVSLGRDKSIIITRVKQNDYCKNQKIGSNKKTTRAFEIAVRNNKSIDIEITVKDQIPLSHVKEIEIEAQDTGDAKYSEKTGELKWLLKIPAGITKKVNFKYEVKYPEDYVMSNLF